MACFAPPQFSLGGGGGNCPLCPPPPPASGAYVVQCVSEICLEYTKSNIRKNQTHLPIILLGLFCNIGQGGLKLENFRTKFDSVQSRLYVRTPPPPPDQKTEDYSASSFAAIVLSYHVVYSMNTFITRSTRNKLSTTVDREF